MIGLQEELDWTSYVAFGLQSDEELVPLKEIESLASEHRPFAIHLARAAERGEATNYWFEAMGVSPAVEVPESYSDTTRTRLEARLKILASDPTMGLIDTANHKRKWEPVNYASEVDQAAHAYLLNGLEAALEKRGRPAEVAHLVSSLQDDSRFLAVASIYQKRRDVDLAGLVSSLLVEASVPNHSLHVYTPTGASKRAAWERVWAEQRREDAGEAIDEIPVPPEYSQGSRGKSKDFLETRYWRLRGKLDVPKERFVAFTEVPGREGDATLYGWAGWTPLQRVKALLAIDEELEDGGVPIADRVGLLDSAWRLLPDVAREDAAAASRLKAELQALVGADGPSAEMLEDWRTRFPPPKGRTKRKAKKAPRRKKQ